MAGSCINYKAVESLHQKFNLSKDSFMLFANSWAMNNELNKDTLGELEEYIRQRMKELVTFKCSPETFDNVSKVYEKYGNGIYNSVSEANSVYSTLSDIMGEENVAKYQDRVGNWVVRAAKPIKMQNEQPDSEEYDIFVADELEHEQEYIEQLVENKRRFYNEQLAANPTLQQRFGEKYEVSLGEYLENAIKDNSIGAAIMKNALAHIGKLADIKVKLKFYENPTENDPAGEYIPETNEIILYGNFENVDQNLIHEMIHAIIFNNWRKTEFAGEFSKVFNEIKKRLLKKHGVKSLDEIKDPYIKRLLYGLTNEDEFISEFFANRAFNTEIKSIDNNETLIDRFVNLIQRIISLFTHKPVETLGQKRSRLIKSIVRSYDGTLVEKREGLKSKKPEAGKFIFETSRKETLKNAKRFLKNYYLGGKKQTTTIKPSSEEIQQYKRFKILYPKGYNPGENMENEYDKLNLAFPNLKIVDKNRIFYAVSPKTEITTNEEYARAEEWLNSMSDDAVMDEYTRLLNNEAEDRLFTMPITQQSTNIMESKGGYAQRTRENADWSDITLALAVDFSTYGERATKKAAGNKYIHSMLTGDLSIVVEELYNQIISNNLPTKNIKLNVAGNGIYSLVTNEIDSPFLSQNDINNTVTSIIKLLQERKGIAISEIRSGGQTGIDEAGIIAAQRLGIPSSVNAPKGFAFRDANGKDHYNREEFIARFQQQPAQQPVTQETNPVVTEQQRQAEETNKKLQQEYDSLTEEEKRQAEEEFGKKAARNDSVVEKKDDVEMKTLSSIPAKELHYLNTVAMNAVSELITSLIEQENLQGELFGDTIKTKLFGLSRQEVIDTVGIEELLNVVKELYFNTYGYNGTSESPGDSNFTDKVNYDVLDKLDIIYNNWNAFIALGYKKLLKNEKIVLTDSVESDIEFDGIDEEFSEEIDSEASEDGELQAWQIGHQHVSAESRISDKVRRMLSVMPIIDENGEYPFDEFGYNWYTFEDEQKCMAKLLEWLSPCETLSEMKEVLKVKANANKWVYRIIGTPDMETGEYTGGLLEDEKFANEFFSSFKNNYVRYSSLYRKGNKFELKILTEKSIITDIVNSVTYAFGAGEISFLPKSKNGFRFDKDKANEILRQLDDLKKIQKAGIKGYDTRIDFANALLDLLESFGIDKTLFTDDIINNWVNGRFKSIAANLIRGMNDAIGEIRNQAGRENYKPFDFENDEEKAKQLYSIFKKIGIEISNVVSDSIEASVYENGKTYYAYNRPSFMARLMNNLKNVMGNQEKFEKYVRENFGNYLFFTKNPEADFANLEFRNKWLQEIVKNPDASKVFEHTQLLNFDKVKYEDLTPLKYALSIYEMFNSTKSSKTAFYVIPMLSDKPASEFVKFFRYSEDEIVTSLCDDTFTQEILRIREVLEMAATDKREIKNYDISVKDRKDKNVAKLLKKVEIAINTDNKDYGITAKEFVAAREKLQKSGARFTFLNMLNNLDANSDLLQDIVEIINGRNVDPNTFQPKLRAAVQQMIEDFVASETKFMVDSGFFTTEKVKGKEVFKYLGGSEATDKNREKHLARMREFIVNNMFAQMNIIQLTNTDPAFFKDSDDYQKRNAQIHAPGMRCNIEAFFIKDDKQVRYSDDYSRAMYLKDHITPSELIDGVKVAFADYRSSAPKDEHPTISAIESQIIKAFEEVNVADAQAYSCPTSYRKKMAMFGQWSDEQERAYQRIVKGDFNIDDIGILCQPLKPFVFTKHNIGNSIAPVPLQHKNSEYMIFLAGALMQGTKQGQYNKLAVIYDFMEATHYSDRLICRNGKLWKDGVRLNEEQTAKEGYSFKDGMLYDKKGNVVKDGTILREGDYKQNGIDTIMFESAVKVGLHDAVDLNDVESYDEIYDRLNNGIVNADKFSFLDYSIQQPVPEHFKDHRQLYGSQIRILGFSDIDPKATFSNGMTGTSLRKRAEDLFARNIEISMQTLQADLLLDKDALKLQLSKDLNGIKDDDKMKSALNNYVSSYHLTAEKARDIYKTWKNNNKNLEKTLESVNLAISRKERNIVLSELMKDTVKKSAKYSTELLKACTLVDGEFNLPLCDPLQAEQVETLLNSIIKSRINKQKIAGGPVVQTSVWGMTIGSDDLHVLYDRKGRVKGVEAYIPYPSQAVYDAMKKYDKDGNFIGMMTIEEAKKFGIVNDDMLKGISYRIPTEDKYSMMPIVVKGFMSRSAGEVIVLPKEITALSGSDFDIDKDYIMMKSVVNKPAFDVKALAEDFKAQTGAERSTALDNFIESVKKDGLYKAYNALSDTKASQTIKYLIDKNAGKYYQMFQLSTNETERNNNELIDLQFEVLTHQDTAVKFYNVGNFEEIKHYGKMMYVIQNHPELDPNDVAKMSPKEINDLFESEQKNLYKMSTQVYFHNQNMTAAKLIGIFANANTSHAFINPMNIKYNREKKTFAFDGTIVYGDTKLDPTKSNDGVFVSKRLASFLAASVDAVKDPVLNLMNINKTTINVAITLARLGFTTKQIALFLSQPAIKEATTRFAIVNESAKTTIHNVIYKMFKEAKVNWKKTQKIVFGGNERPQTFFYEFEMLKGMHDNPTSDFQMRCLALYDHLSRMGEELTELTFLTKFNSVTNTVGPRINKSVAMFNRVDEITEKDGKGSYFPGHWSVLMNNKIVATFYKSLRKLNEQMFQGYFPQYSPAFMGALSLLSTYTKYKPNERILKKFLNFYMLWQASNFITFNEDIRKDLASEEWMRELHEFAKNSDNELFTHLRFKPADQRKGSPSTANVAAGKMTFADQETLKNAWTEMLLHGTTEEKNIAIKFFFYNLFRSGFNYSPKTCLHLASVEFKQNLEGYIDFLNRLPFDIYMSADRMFIQFLRNNSDDSALVPAIDDSYEDMIHISGDKLTITGDDDSLEGIITEETKDGKIFVQIVKHEDDIYQFENFYDNTVYYTKTTKLGIKNEFIEVDSSETNPESVFPINNGRTQSQTTNWPEDMEDTDTNDSPANDEPKEIPDFDILRVSIGNNKKMVFYSKEELDKYLEQQYSVIDSNASQSEKNRAKAAIQSVNDALENICK